MLGAVYEDSENEIEVLRAVDSLGHEPIEEDLLGVEELRFEKYEWEKVSMASEESLIRQQTYCHCKGYHINSINSVEGNQPAQ